ncbi:MAG: trigger factor [Verrucomicrobiae bacterium]|nr:trigger factor [Verrucomicrobiae bacterium]
MHITTEQKENSVLDLHIELPPEYFKKEWKKIAQEYVRLARIPGFRKGKAPLSAIEKKYGADIEKEALQKTIESALREVIRDKQFKLAQYPELKEKQLEKDHTLRFTVTIVMSPEVDLPEYRGLSLSVEKEMVSDKRLEELLEKMRNDFAEFINVEERGLEMGDFAVLDYDATVNGQGLLEIDSEIPLSFVGGKNRWMQLAAQYPIPGLAESLLGLKPQESRTSSVTYPSDFSEKALQSITVTYEVTLHEIKNRQPAPLDDTLAARVKPGMTLEALRQEMRDQLVSFVEQQFQTNLRSALIQELLTKIPCEAPTPLVQQESHSILEKIIRENQSRGVSEEEIRSHQQELLESAQKSADEKMRLHFILNAIAAKEKIEVTPEEFNSYLTLLAERYKMTLKKLISELQKNRALGGIQEELLFNKTLEFLTTHSNVTEIPTSKETGKSHTHDHAQPHVHGPHCKH